MHGNAFGTSNLGGIRRSLPGTALNNPPARFGVSAGNVFDHLG